MKKSKWDKIMHASVCVCTKCSLRRKRTAENLMSESKTVLKELRRLKKELLYNKKRGALRARLIQQENA